MSNPEPPIKRRVQLQKQVTDIYKKVTLYARTELKDFHLQYNQQINHIMGFLVQLDNMVTYL